MKIVMSKGGTAEREVELKDIHVPDLWHVAMLLRDQGLQETADFILEAWHLAHDLLYNLREIAGNHK